MNKSDIAVSIHQIQGIGSRLLGKIDEIVQGEWNLLMDDPSIVRKLNVSEDLLDKIYTALKPSHILKIHNELNKNNIHVVMFGDDLYPRPLAEIHQPPFILYCLGNIQLLREQNMIAIVGTRVPSAYGKIVTHRLASDLATAGWTIISGMAAGIDADAHRGALSVNGKTIAVLGNGIKVIFPKENSKLYHDLVEQGLIVSEYPPDLPPQKGFFPQRNRIISGLSRGVVVVESHQRSGSLITASYALEQGREVFAVPGSILSAKSSGPHQLIKEGAKLVTCAQDIIDELSYPINIERMYETAKNELNHGISTEEQTLLEIISYHQIHIDEIFRVTSLPAHQIHHILLQLEAKGKIKRLPGYFYIRC